MQTPVHPLLMLFFWIASVGFGILQMPVWLVIPPIVCLIGVVVANQTSKRVLKNAGVENEVLRQFDKETSTNNFTFVIWQALLHTILFGVGYFISGLF